MLQEDEYYKMAELEHTHWWYRALHNLAFKAIGIHFKSKDIKIIDAGCGTGGLMMFLKSKGYENIMGFDLSETAVKICKQRNLNVFRGDLSQIPDYFDGNSADIIISNDTLYFFNDADVRKITDSMYGILKDSGLLIINMPSLEAFRGMHDIRVGINKRFSKKNIPKVFNPDNFKLLNGIFWPFLLSPLIWFSRFRQRMKMKINVTTEMKSDLKKENGFINSVLFLLTSFENILLNKKPFGSSLFLVLRKVNLNQY